MHSAYSRTRKAPGNIDFLFLMFLDSNNLNNFVTFSYPRNKNRINSKEQSN